MACCQWYIFICVKTNLSSRSNMKILVQRVWRRTSKYLDMGKEYMYLDNFFILFLNGLIFIYCCTSLVPYNNDKAVSKWASTRLPVLFSRSNLWQISAIWLRKYLKINQVKSSSRGRGGAVYLDTFHIRVWCRARSIVHRLAPNSKNLWMSLDVLLLNYISISVLILFSFFLYKITTQSFFHCTGIKSWLQQQKDK